jgi:hypothetical protein
VPFWTSSSIIDMRSDPCFSSPCRQLLELNFVENEVRGAVCTTSRLVPNAIFLRYRVVHRLLGPRPFGTCCSSPASLAPTLDDYTRGIPILLNADTLPQAIGARRQTQTARAEMYLHHRHAPTCPLRVEPRSNFHGDLDARWG